MPLFELVVAPLVVHRLELLVIGDHRRPEAEAARERGHDDPPGRLLLVPFFLGNEIVGIDQFLHPLDDIGIGFLDALGSDVELEEAMHRRLARDEVEPVVTLGFLPPVKRRDDVDLDGYSLEEVVVPFAVPRRPEATGPEVILFGRLAGIELRPHRVARGFDRPFQSVDRFVSDVIVHFRCSLYAW